MILFPSPKSDMDYGTLSCAGYNDVGRQMTPCTFTIRPASEGINSWH